MKFHLKFAQIKTKSEIECLVELIREIWPEVFIPIIGEEQVDYMLVHYQGEAVIAAEIENGIRYFFIEDSDMLIGYFAYSLEEDNLAISKIYLKKSLRGFGLSSKVFSYLEEVAQENNKGKLSLRVNRSNKQAVEVYLRQGFEIVKIVDQPFGEKFFLNDYCMEKKI